MLMKMPAWVVTKNVCTISRTSSTHLLHFEVVTGVNGLTWTGVANSAMISGARMV